MKVSEIPCKVCNGLKLVTKEDGKTTACKKCNGTGLHLSTLNRNNRARGHANERRLAKTLKTWWDKDGQYQFLRTPQSGGSKLKDGWQLAGDIATNAPDWPFHVECKREKGWDILQLITTESGGRVAEYWHQACNDKRGDAVPMVIMSHTDSTNQYVLLPITFSSNLLCEIKVGKVLQYEKFYIFDLKDILTVSKCTMNKIADYLKVPFG